MHYPDNSLTLMTKPTRLTHHTSTLRDHIYTNSYMSVDASIALVDVSDFLPVFCMLDRQISSLALEKAIPLGKRLWRSVIIWRPLLTIILIITIVIFISCGLFLDFSKAFDIVNYQILSEKLYKYGVRGRQHDWFASYLQDRKQFVQIRDEKSSLL